MLLSFLSAWLVFKGSASYLHLALGGLLFQFASIVDGCDGEIAKLKFMGSRMGEWVDTLADNMSYLVFFIAVPRRDVQLYGRGILSPAGAV